MAGSSRLSKPHVDDGRLTPPPGTIFGDNGSGSDDNLHLDTEPDAGEIADVDMSDPAEEPPSSRVSARIMTPSASAPTEGTKEVYRSDDDLPPVPPSFEMVPDQDVA